MASRPYKISDYLQNPADRIAYLNEALESGDFKLFLSALKNVAEITDTEIDKIKYEPSDFLSLNKLLHSIGLRLAVETLDDVEDT